MGIAATVNDYRNGVAGANGTVTLTFGPVPPWCQWTVNQLSIDLSRGTGKCSVQHGPTTSAISIDSTHLANANQTSPMNWVLRPGEVLTLSFSLLQNGVTASAQLRYDQTRYP